MMTLYIFQFAWNDSSFTNCFKYFFMIQENLRKHKDVRFSSDYSDKNNNELENLSGDDFVGFDLCILSTRKTSLQKLNGLK